jgi:hypothetical protein
MNKLGGELRSKALFKGLLRLCGRSSGQQFVRSQEDLEDVENRLGAGNTKSRSVGTVHPGSPIFSVLRQFAIAQRRAQTGW